MAGCYWPLVASRKVLLNWPVLTQCRRSSLWKALTRKVNVDDYQAKITSLLYDEVRAAIPPLLEELAGQTIFAFGLVSYDGPWIQSVAACSREGLKQHLEKSKGISSMSESAAETSCAEWNYLASAVAESLDISYELIEKFYDGSVDGLDESVGWEAAKRRFNRVFLEAGVHVLSRLREDGSFPVPPFEKDLFLGLHNPDPGRLAVQRMIDSSKILNSPEWHAKFVAELPDPTSIEHE